VAKVNATTFQPGDSILFQRGAEFSAALNASSSGTSSAPITYGAYGDSSQPNPDFLGSDVLNGSNFTLVTGTTYSTPSTTAIGWVFDNHQFTNESQDQLTQSGSTNATDPATNINYVESNSESFYDDTATNTLYVNLGGSLSGHVITATTRPIEISSNNQSNVVFTNLDVLECAADNNNFAFYATGQSSNVQFLNCTATSTGKHAFGALDVTDFLGENLTADQTAPGLGFGGASAFVAFSDNTVTDTTSTWTNCTYINSNGAYECFVTHGDTGSIGSIVINNMVSNNGYGSGIFTEPTGNNETITINGGSLDGGVDLTTNNSVINGLTVSNTSNGTIDLAGNNDVIQNSILTDLSPDIEAGHNGGIVVSGTGDVMRFNTFSFTSPYGPAIDVTDTSANTSIYANIFDCPVPIWLNFNQPGASLTSDYNLFDPGAEFLDTPSFEVISLQQYQALGYDANSVSADPQFADAATGNYQLLVTSPAIGLYTQTPDISITPITTDFAGNPRPYIPGAYDAGAYEYQFPITGTLSVSDVALNAPLPGTIATAAFTVTLSSAQTNTTTVQFATSDGTAVAGVDYTQASGTLTFAPGVTSQTVDVTVSPSLTANSSKTFQLTLSSPNRGIALGTATATATISSIGETSSTFTRKTPLLYTDGDNNKVTLKLGGVGTGTALFVSGNADPVEILLSGTTRASSFSVLSVRAPTDLGELVVAGPIGSIIAAASLTNGLTIAGTVNSLSVDGAAGALALQSAADRPSLHLGTVSGATLNSASAIASLSATSWTGGEITAPSIGAMQVKSSFDPTVNLTAGGLALASASLGAVPSGSWTVTGDIGGIAVSGSFSGTIIAPAIRSMQVRGNLTAATLTLNGSRGIDLAALSVGGSVTNSDVRSAASIGSITVGDTVGSIFFAGISSSVTALPTATADFTASDQIASFTVTAPRSFANGFSSSDVAADRIGTIKVQRVLTSNGGVAFGFATTSLASFIDIETGKKPLKWKPGLNPSLLSFSGDFKVSLL
jgi:hypothetical protein